jgi:hypothetical protein
MKILIRLVVFAMVPGGAGIQAYSQDNRFVQTILVANDPAFKPRILDETMVNAWGIAVRPPARAAISGLTTPKPVSRWNTSETSRAFPYIRMA